MYLSCQMVRFFVVMQQTLMNLRSFSTVWMRSSLDNELLSFLENMKMKKQGNTMYGL